MGQIDLFAESARELRDLGMARVARSSGDDWQDLAMGFLTEWIKHKPGPFFIEDVRHAAEARGIEPPPDRRAWGVVAMRAARAGFIRRVGYGPQKSPNAHMAPKSIWQARGGSRPARGSSGA